MKILSVRYFFSSNGEYECHVKVRLPDGTERLHIGVSSVSEKAAFANAKFFAEQDAAKPQEPAHE